MTIGKFLKFSVIGMSAAALAACVSSPDNGSVGSVGNSGAVAPNWHFSQKGSLMHNDIVTKLVVLTKHVPTNVSAGQVFESAIDVMARAPLSHTMVVDTIPNGMTVVKTDPNLTVNGNRLMWDIGNMDRGEIKTLHVWLKATDQGTSHTCTTITAVPRTCHAITVGSPDLILEKRGPEKVQVGSKFDYEIMVKNVGNQPANNVKLMDNLPAALSPDNQNASLNYNVGTLQPGTMSPPIIVHSVARTRGDHCNTANVIADNHGPVDSQACTTVYQPMVAIQKSGSPAAMIGKQAAYRITVNNSGDTDLSNVIVTDVAPNSTRIVAAQGGQVSGNTVTWRLPHLSAGMRQDFNVTLTSATPGKLCNQARVSAGGLNDSSYACTVWRGMPALLVETGDSRDALLVGDTTEYTIQVTNQGSAPDHDLKINVRFPNNIQPMNAPGSINSTGDSVDYRIDTLAPKQTATYVIRAKATAPGKNKVVTTVTTPSLPTPVVEEESTSVY
ncbi:MAG: DUF11 domain-containing protein [Gammaproteobacteria bacterium]|nr:DUF11 domain-containing protein [Gammaproteobacteria bacterium]